MFMVVIVMVVVCVGFGLGVNTFTRLRTAAFLTVRLLSRIREWWQLWWIALEHCNFQQGRTVQYRLASPASRGSNQQLLHSDVL
jgi:hypothetical protein